jgi:hypothetical protein
MSKKKKKKKPKQRNLDVIWMIVHTKGGTHQDKRLKRIKDKIRKEIEEDDL